MIAWTAATVFAQHHYYGFTRTGYWTIGVIIAAVLVISVLLHELAHSIVALRYGIKVRQIILFIFGGIPTSLRNHKTIGKKLSWFLQVRL